jgi:hypothetical protein
MSIAPEVPPVPGPGASAEEVAAYRWAVTEANRAALAQAQADTASAIREAKEVQAQLVEAMNKPEPRRALTQGDLVRMLIPIVPMRVGDTEATYAKAVNDQAAKLLPLVNA